MKHTPAPWNYRPVPSDSFDGKTSFWIDLPNGAPIADVRTRPDEEHAANARLIAQAPAMHAELENALYLFWMVQEGKAIAPAELQNRIDAVSEILARAKG